MDRWIPVMYKDIGYIEQDDGAFIQGDVEPLTEDEIKIREEYQSFGLVPLNEDDIIKNVLDGPEGFEESQISKLR
jgi:cytoskeletal protein CcmA (bactofilin family)